MVDELTRRTFVVALGAAGGLAAAGCGRAERKQPAPAQPANTAGASARPAPRSAAAMTVYRDPSCGCCEAWTQIARQAGYQVSLIDHPDMPAIKRQYGVPDELRSCHTAIVADYVVEGHVPLDVVKRLLAERPSGVKGIAVAGMPRGSPGMETPDGSSDPFNVMAFDAAGTVSDYA